MHEHLAESYCEAFAAFEPRGNQRSGAHGAWAPPTMLVTDGEWALLNGMASYWKAGIGADCGTGSAPYAKRCEWHLRKNAKLAAEEGGHYELRPPDPAHPGRGVQDPCRLDAFCLAAADFPQIARYVKRNDAQVRDQVARRALFPSTTAAPPWRRARTGPPAG